LSQATDAGAAAPGNWAPAGRKNLDPHWSPLAVDHQMHPTGDLLGMN